MHSRLLRCLVLSSSLCCPLAGLWGQHPNSNTAAAEICDNGADDDNDGYVDCYDADCHCFSGTDCSVTELPSDFRARLAWQSAQNGPSVTAVPAVANMNPWQDSMPEIIVAAAAPNGSSLANRILFFRGDGSNLANPLVLTVPGGFDPYPVPGPAIGDVNADGRPELIMSCNDRRIRVFRNYAETPGAPMSLWITSSGQLDYTDQKPYLADFNGDGIAEIYAGSDIFQFDFSNPASPQLNKVINGPGYIGQAMYSVYQEGSCSPTAADLLSVADCNGDPDCAGLELVAGPAIYSIDLDPADGDGYQIKIKRDLNQLAPGNAFGDGYTAAADIDLDGVLDVVVSARRNNAQTGVYVWNKNGLLRFFAYPGGNARSGSLACVANLYDDRTRGFAQDFPEILVCNAYNLNCFNLQAAQATPATPYWWSLPTEDYSGFTGSSVYDFNGDGIFEVVYRDEDHFRILYGGPAPFPAGVDAERNWFKIPCGSLTADEYPIVADVDNDGETEIAVTGYPFSGYNSPISDYRGRLRVFESDAEPWVPCRNVWNQYNYFVVNVNDDLSIPAQQQGHHLELPAAGTGNRPLNRYLSQRPLLDENFQPFLPVPDALASVEELVCADSILYALVKICNNGSHKLKQGTAVTFYSADPTASAAPVLGNVQFTDAEVGIGECHAFLFSVPFHSGTLYGVVNDDGSKARPFDLNLDFPVTDQIECYWPNNIFQFEFEQTLAPFDLGPDYASCKDTVVLLNAGAGHLSYRWQDGSADSVLLAQGPGLYWVEVSGHCMAKRADTVLITAYGYPQIQLDTVNGDCFGKPAAASVQAGGNYLPLSYAWSTGSQEAFIEDVPDGVYTVSVTDAKGCRSVDSTWVEAGGRLEVQARISAIRCAGLAGEIGLTISAGKAPFAFQWSAGAGDSILQQVYAGEYSVLVSDADGCAQTLHISMPEPAPLQSQGLNVRPACPGESNGSAVFGGAAQGTPPYSWLWSTGSDSVAIAGLPAGVYQITVSDANGCTLVEAVSIPEFEMPALTGQVADVACSGGADGAVSLELSGGSPAFGFAWSEGQTQQNIENLTAGAYSLTLTYADGQCRRVFDFQVQEPLPLVSAGTSAQAACPGASNGSAAFMGASQGTPPYTLSWFNGAGTDTINGLPGGYYSLTVSDSKGCTLVDSVWVPEFEAPSVMDTLRDVSCFGFSDGRIAVGTSGGSPPVSYSWSDGSTAFLAQDLAAGTYLLTLGFAGGKCFDEFQYEIGQPLPLQSAGITAAPACPGEANGALVYNGAMQGTPPYHLQWSTGGNLPEQHALAAGAYQITITDANGCTLTDAAVVPALEAPLINGQVAPVSCHGGQDGAINVSLSGGAPDFGYQWSNGSASPIMENLWPGNYELTLTYAGGKCSSNAAYQVGEPPALLIQDAGVTPARCFGGHDGAVDVSPAGGTPPYQFNWSGGGQNEDIETLPAGMYTLTLTDANGCTLSASFQVTEPPKIEIQTEMEADSCESANGALRISAQGGVSPYAYNWSNGASLPELYDLAAGPYRLTLTDAHDCFQMFDLDVPAAGKIPHISAFSDTITCAQPYAVIGVTADQNELHYSWTSPEGGLPDQPGHVVFDAGIYKILATNAFGCQAFAQAEVVEDRALPAAEAGAERLTIPCDVAHVILDASASSTGKGYSNRWVFIRDGAVLLDTATIILPASQPGWYFHRVRNLENGCVASDSVFVERAAPVLAVESVDSITCFGANDGIIRLQLISGGTPPIYYSIDNQNYTKANTFFDLPPGNYPASIRDDYGCSWETLINLREPDSLSVKLISSDTEIELGHWIQLEAKPQPPNVVLSAVSWQPSGFNYLSNTLRQQVRPEENTEFAVTIVDERGCVAGDRILVKVHNYQIYVPNVIYPGSSTNGWFTIFAGDGVQEIRLLRIYDRWGNFVFENRHFLPNVLTAGWDGAFRGGEMNPGVFAWYAEIELQDGQVRLLKGDVTVLR